jgi:hypothetical protein
LSYRSSFLAPSQRDHQDAIAGVLRHDREKDAILKGETATR